MDIDDNSRSHGIPDPNTKPSNITPRSAEEQTRGTSTLHSSDRKAGMSIMTSSESRSEHHRYEDDARHPSRSRPAPPLQPYVADEKRVHPPRISGWRTVPDPRLDRYYGQSDRARPPPIHNTPAGNEWQRQLERGSDSSRMRSSGYAQHSPSYNSHHPHPYHPPGDRSPRSVPASGSGYGPRVQLPLLDKSAGSSAMQRSMSARSHQSIPMSRALSRNSSNHSRRSSGTSSVVDDVDEKGVWSSSAPMFDSKRRTRALMTKSQMSELKRSWRDTKFPGNEEREALGRKIGLTPRQVQVWFQNQRQKIRKEINESKVPAGANPQDYVDLDKSPRSRKLTLETSGSGGRPAALSTSSSDRSGSSMRHQVSGLGLQTPRDDDSRSIATGSSISAPYPTTAESYHHPGQTGFWDQNRTHSSHPNQTEPHPFAFHKPPTPGSQPRPSPYEPRSPLTYLDPRPSDSANPHYTHNIPPPIRHAATDGEPSLRRTRSNSLENLSTGIGLDVHSHRPISNSISHSNTTRSTYPPSRPSSQNTTSQLPPSLAALALPGPMHDQHNMQRYTSDQGYRSGPSREVPTLPPPRGWITDRPDTLSRGQSDPTRGGRSNDGSRLPGYQGMFGREGPSDRRR